MVFDFQIVLTNKQFLKPLYRQIATNVSFLDLFASTLLFLLHPFLSQCPQKPLRSSLEAKHRHPVVQISAWPSQEGGINGSKWVKTYLQMGIVYGNGIYGVITTTDLFTFWSQHFRNPEHPTSGKSSKKSSLKLTHPRENWCLEQWFMSFQKMVAFRKKNRSFFGS